MNRSDRQLDDELFDWGALSQRLDFSGILVGNGASRAVWDGFSYQSLFDLACGDIEHPLIDVDRRLFDQLGGTRNFELVLSALSTSGVVNDVLEQARGSHDQAYERIRVALVEAVRGRHVPWTALNDQAPSARQLISSELKRYRFVYSTNYDLLLYWSVMYDPGSFKDYFWTAGGAFNPTDTRVWGTQSCILYLHGGLHLLKATDGSTIKRSGATNAGLLELFGQPVPAHPGAVPLFVAEGTSPDKMRAISRSSYLVFAYLTLTRHEGPLCVFGHSLGESDRHIVEAVEQSQAKEIAISVRRTESKEIIRTKAKFVQLFPESTLFFYDAATHPLGSTTVCAG